MKKPFRFNYSYPQDRKPELWNGPPVSCYKPLSLYAIRKMLKLASRKMNDPRFIAQVQIRLNQAMKGAVCPWPAFTDMSFTEARNKLDLYYVNVFCQKPQGIGAHARKVYELINWKEDSANA